MHCAVALSLAMSVKPDVKLPDLRYISPAASDAAGQVASPATYPTTLYPAIEAHASELRDKVVLDVGCGTGILSMFAARAGARKVYAVDASGITRHASRLVAENGYEGVVDVIRGRVEDLTSEDIPERVDGVYQRTQWSPLGLRIREPLQATMRLAPDCINAINTCRAHCRCCPVNHWFARKLQRCFIATHS